MAFDFYTYCQFIGPYRYIGKGKGLRYLDNHISNKNNHYNRSMKKYGMQGAVIIQYYDNEELALSAEIEMISLQKSIGNKLLNKLPGGKQPPKAKKGQGKGRMMSEVGRAKLKGRKAWNKGLHISGMSGKHQTDDHKAKIGASNSILRKGSKQSKETVDKRMAKSLLKLQDPDWKKEQSIRMKAWWAARKAG